MGILSSIKQSINKAKKERQYIKAKQAKAHKKAVDAYLMEQESQRVRFAKKKAKMEAAKKERMFKEKLAKPKMTFGNVLSNLDKVALGSSQKVRGIAKKKAKMVDVMDESDLFGGIQ